MIYLINPSVKFVKMKSNPRLPSVSPDFSVLVTLVLFAEKNSDGFSNLSLVIIFKSMHTFGHFYAKH